LSQGNIGVALHLWQANIESIHKNVIVIKHPNKEEMPLLTNTDWQVLLVQFVIHKHLTIARIKRIFDHSDKKQSEDLLNNLMRSGLVEQIMGSTYRIPPYLTGAVSKYLKESKVL
jgi:predicted transcriptional regulator of viral defense system